MLINYLLLGNVGYARAQEVGRALGVPASTTRKMARRVCSGRSGRNGYGVYLYGYGWLLTGLGVIEFTRLVQERNQQRYIRQYNGVRKWARVITNKLFEDELQARRAGRLLDASAPVEGNPLTGVTRRGYGALI